MMGCRDAGSKPTGQNRRTGQVLTSPAALDAARTDVARAVEDAQRILAVSHISPDGDAVGSLLGLGWMLEYMGKEFRLVCADPVPRNYRYLPGSETITQNVDLDGVDLVVALDSSDPGRLGAVADAEGFQDVPLANVDHHVTNTGYGKWNWVDPSLAATTELVIQLADELGVEMTTEMALCLLNGLVTDTRGFRTGNTTAYELKAAVQLMERGASLRQVMHHGLNTRPLASIRLWGLALASMQMKDHLIWAEVTLETQRQAGGSDASNGSLVNFLLAAEGAHAAVVFTEKEKGAAVEVGFRSLPGVDISGVALELGGGGHPQAAGCTVSGPLAEAKSRVLSAVEEAIRDQSPLDA
jgi:phosphoesterase RecJ-like protein